MRVVLLNAFFSAVLAAVGIAAYDHFVVRPSQIVGVVDLSEIYRSKEAEFAHLMSAGGSGEGRARATALARAFAQRLPGALEELPQECACLVILRSSLVGTAPREVDMTPLLIAKLEGK